MPRTAHHTRDRFIDAGITLVQRQSFDGIGVAEIAKQSGAPKGSFYNHFTSKEEFGAAIIDAYAERETTLMREVYRITPGTPLEKLRTLVENFRDTFVSTGFEGCLVGCMSATSGDSPQCRAAAERAFERSFHLIEGFLRDARDAGEISRTADLSLLARLFQSMAQGAVILAKAKGSGQPFDDVLSGFFPLLRSA